ncbi:hypothetical protein QFC21_006259 [Naganishia friedmannii]|uniref:Uncharacterized protein n=1 Tax=Naganishia friedmannii TaxID=89922 RepID=A0ACC2V4W8_9TREE|nr:hypothetical protein QFC21_006259 [Naganishia friedmannii]
MDIDSPPAASHSNTTALNLPTFSSAFPLPFRVLALIGLAILLWAVNVHVLTALGVDFGWAVDLGGLEGSAGVEEAQDGDGYAQEREQVEDVLFEYNNNMNHQQQQQQPQRATSTHKPAVVPAEFSDDLPRPSFDGYGRTVASPGEAAGGGGTTVGTRAVFVFPTSRNGSVVSFPGGDDPHARENGRDGGGMDLSSFFGRDGNGDHDNDEKNRDRPTPHSVYRSIYALFLVYSVYVGSAWLLFRLITTPTSTEISNILAQSMTTASSSGSGETLTWEEASGQAERQKMEQYRAFVGLAVGGLAVMGFGTGFGVGRWKVGERERQSLLRSIRRILLPPASYAPFFADVILADIMTSFAKVLGDVYVSACQIWSGGITKGRVRVGGAHDWIVLGMVSLPYILRLRQCLNEYLIPSNTSSRPLLNALKYATAFPVIFLSAAQRTVVKQVAEQYGVTPEELVKSRGRWFGEHRLFRLWLLAVIVNSMYSFWWDVTNDWGLGLLKVETWVPDHFASGAIGLPITTPTTPRFSATDARGTTVTRVVLSRLYRLLRSIRSGGSKGTAATPQAGEYELLSAFPGVADEHQRSPMPSPQSHLRRRSSFTVPLSANPNPNPNPNGDAASSVGGVGGGDGRGGTHSRSQSHSSHFNPATLSGPINTHATSRSRNDPVVYHLFIAIDFILRFTWSLKLSSHLHTIAEIESGVFMMEALELMRRWMWVFLRTEWEVVKKMEAERDALQERRYRRHRAESVGKAAWGGEDGPAKQSGGRSG